MAHSVSPTPTRHPAPLITGWCSAKSHPLPRPPRLESACQSTELNHHGGKRSLSKRRVNLAFSERLQKGQKLVGWTIAASLDLERLCFRERLFFEFEIGVKINLGRIH